MTKRLSTIAIHVFGCLTFLALPYLFASDGFDKLAELSYNPHERRNVVSYLITIAFFYINYYVLIPRLYFNRRYVLYGVSALGCFVLIESVLFVINRGQSRPPMERRQPPPERNDYQPSFPNDNRPPRPSEEFGQMGPSDRRGLPPESSQTFFLTLAGFLLALAIRVNNRLRETEREKIQTELSYLKAQINPHFLFNTLNSIYALSIIDSPPTADAIVKLSSFLRYVIQDSQKDLVSLANELDYISHYVALQKLRIDSSVEIDFTINGRPNGKQIAPLLLISFIENAFKYGVSPEEPSAIKIRITIGDTELECYVFNKKVRVFQPMAVASGIGLTNTQARLDLLYPNRHRLVISDKPDSFIVDLTLTLS
ncbi:sensor histidine kinase [Spirosoma sp. BT702]|uniref:Sensor histidine kinase n=1 Tax=Spirosoma profusum TaxID=2771354 RepID=A0A927ATC6_9BACT|nr:sensor histidine kinase [Spirosoma profusum]MBD2703170.1 sensor histidine kinase [Spirosoma profusum]